MFDLYYCTFQTQRLDLKIDNFYNGDNSEVWTMLSKRKLRDLIDNMLGLDDESHAHYCGTKF